MLDPVHKMLVTPLPYSPRLTGPSPAQALGREQLLQLVGVDARESSL